MLAADHIVKYTRNKIYRVIGFRQNIDIMPALSLMDHNDGDRGLLSNNS